MKSHHVAWIALTGLVSASVSLGIGCGADESNNTSASAGSGFCGNNITEAGEECDDANQVDTDACMNDCTLPVCGDGVVSAGEECDDGNANNADGCTSTCQTASCNLNGMLDPGEECDDGNMINDDGCTNACTEPRCGDGIVQAGEDCDDGNTEFGDNCPNDCMNPSTSSGGGDDCTGQAIYSGIVTNDQNPAQPGAGIPSVWAYGGQLGITAGNDMCKYIGADHICSYAEVVAADAAGELAGLPADQSFWVHRVTETVQVNGIMSPPGAGGRCNDWTYPTGHIADAEFGVLGATTNPPGGQLIGSVTYVFDQDTVYDASAPGVHAGSGVFDGGPCSADFNGPKRAILCCFPVCNK